MKQVLTLFLMLPFYFSSLAQHYCNSPTNINPELANIIKAGQSNHTRSTYEFKVYMHLINEAFTDTEVQTAFDILVADFLPHDISFKWDCYIDRITEVEDIAPTDSDGDGQPDIFSLHAHDDGFDIYLFPDDPNITEDNNGFASGVGMGSALYLSGKVSGDGYDEFLAISHVISHEMGHLLGLLHTHQMDQGVGNPWCTELIDGSNCDECGDYLCDTPMDPNLAGKIKKNISTNVCSWIEASDAATFPTNITNAMSYTPPCCIDNFTDDQSDVMNMVAGLSHLFSVRVDTEPVEISTVETLTGHRQFDTDIIVKPGGILTISGSVSMAEGTSIILESGSIVTINNNAAISNYCGAKWSGIKMDETSSFVFMQDGATIKNATVGVEVKGNAALIAQDANFIDNDVAVTFDNSFNSSNNSIVSSNFINNTIAIEATNSFFSVTDGNTFTGGEVGIDLYGTHPLAGGAIIGSAESNPNIFTGQTLASVKGQGNDHPVGAFIVNNDFDNTDIGTAFLGGDRFEFNNNTVQASDNGIAVFASGERFNPVQCNDFINISSPATSFIWANTGLKIWENHFSGNQLANVALWGSDISDMEGPQGESAENCFSSDAIDIYTGTFLGPTQPFVYRHDGAQSPTCDKEPNNPGTYTVDNGAFPFDYCDEVIGIFDLIDPTGGGSAGIGPDVIGPDSVDPSHPYDPTGDPIQPTGDPTISVVCKPCLTTAIDNAVDDYTNAGGDDPTTISGTIPVAPVANPVTNYNLYNLEDIMIEWINFRLYIAIETGDYSIGTDILDDFLSWKWKTKLYGLHILSGDITSAESLLNTLQPLTVEQSQFVEVQQINIKHIKNETISTQEIDRLVVIGKDKYTTRGAARSVYHVVTGLDMPFELPEISIKPRGKIQNLDDNISIYPNPHQESFTISSVVKIIDFNIYNIQGRLMHNIQPNTKVYRLETDNYRTGIYILEVTDENGKTSVSKVIKQ